MTDREKINNVARYIILAEERYKDDVIHKRNCIYKHFYTDPHQILDLFKAQCKLEAYQEISRCIELILFNNYQDY